MKIKAQYQTNPVVFEISNLAEFFSQPTTDDVFVKNSKGYTFSVQFKDLEEFDLALLSADEKLELNKVLFNEDMAAP